MALKANAFIDDFDGFRESIADLSHYQFMIDWGLKEAKNSATRSLAAMEKMGHKNKFGGGNAITITDVFHVGTGVRRAPGGVRTTQGKKIVPMTKDVEGRFHSYLLVGGFERFEALLKVFFATMLYQLRGQIAMPSKSRFHQNQPKMVEKSGTPTYYLAYAKFACRRNCDEAIAAFEKKLPMQLMTYQWNHGLPFKELFDCLEFCRHSVVHAEGRWPEGTKVSLNRKQQAYIRSCMRASILTGESTILPTDKQTDQVMDMLASYAYGVYILLAEEFGMAIANPFFKRQSVAKN